ncbi:MAG: DUF4340 domain-containing protein [Calditrichae bacterium]|nr:DUF4340 domain-containing protein [Calditrichia bacterium]
MRNTIILVLVAAALGAYVYFYEIKGGEERQADKEREEKLINADKDSIQTLWIYDFDKVFQFSKVDDGWKIVSPVETDAEESTVNSFLATLTGAKKSRTFGVKEKDKSGYGLSRSGIMIKVSNTDGSQDSVILGDKTSIGNNMYVTKGDTFVSISPISLKDAAQKSLFSWRDKRTVHFNKDAVREFNLQTAKGSFSFEKDGSDWKVTKPLQAKADNNEVTAILNKLDFGRIKSVESENAANLQQFHLNAPAYRIELFSGAEKSKSTVMFSKLIDNQSFGKDEVRPQIFTVDSTFLRPFNKSLFDFRDKNLVEFNKSSINRINLLNNGELLTFSKDTSDRWQISTGEPIKNYKINDLVSEVEKLKVDEFVAENPSYTFPYGLTNPKGRLELFAGDSKEIELEFGNSKNGRTFVRNPRTGQVVAIEDSKLEKVLLTMENVYDETAKMVKDNDEEQQK